MSVATRERRDYGQPVRVGAAAPVPNRPIAARGWNWRCVEHSSAAVSDSMCRSIAGKRRHMAGRNGTKWTEGTAPAGAVPGGNTLLAFRFWVAVAHGNRTHRGRLSAPATGFEDRASHQIRTRYRTVLTLKPATRGAFQPDRSACSMRAR